MTHDEMNRLAAIHVMKIEPAQDDSWWDGYYNYSNKGHYCTSIADAMMLPENLDRMWYISCSYNPRDNEWSCYLIDDDSIEFEDTAVELSEAITIVCLKAVGVL